MALRAHLADRGIEVEAGWNPDAALLAPSELANTARGRAKQAQAGAATPRVVSDQLLRGTWKRFRGGRRELGEIVYAAPSGAVSAPAAGRPENDPERTFCRDPNVR